MVVRARNLSFNDRDMPVDRTEDRATHHAHYNAIRNTSGDAHTYGRVFLAAEAAKAAPVAATVH